MNKVIVSALCAGIAFGANAQGKEAHEGFYGGVGVCYHHILNKKTQVYYYDADLALGAHHAYLDHAIIDNKTKKVGGSIVIGHGKFITGNLYGALELTCDITGNKNTDATYIDIDDLGNQLDIGYSSKISGFIPSFALRLGAHCDYIDSLFYTRLGIAQVRSEFTELHDAYKHNTRKFSKIAPLVGVGIETKICDFNCRLECDYRFQTRKEDNSDVVAPDGDYVVVSHKTKGYTGRFLVTYNIKI